MTLRQKARAVVKGSTDPDHPACCRVAEPVQARRALMASMLGATIPWSGCTQTPTEVIILRNPRDGQLQRCTWRAAAGPSRFLVVSLPTWSGSHAQADPLLPHCMARNWAYLRPNVRAPNRTPQACLSESVLSDLQHALGMAESRGGPFVGRILVGESGGGYTALGAWLRMSNRFQGVIVWNPISSLELWYRQTREAHPQFAADILACTASGGQLDAAEASRRSPVNWIPKNLPIGMAPLELFAGIRDGHQGSVPIDHSLAFFRAIAQATKSDLSSLGLNDHTAQQLLARHSHGSPTGHRIAGRDVYFEASCPPATLTVFDGAHEQLVEHTLARAEAMLKALT